MVASASSGHKMVFVVNPINHPVLPKSSSHDLKVGSCASGPYHRLEGESLDPPDVITTSLFSICLPERSSFLPVLSFVTKKDFLDLPIPSLPDFVVTFREVIPEREEYCRSLLAPLQKLDQDPSLVSWSSRENCLFFRGSPSHFALQLLDFESTERSLLVARSYGVLEFVDQQLKVWPNVKFERYFLEEKSEFNYCAMFNSLLRCRFAL